MWYGTNADKQGSDTLCSDDRSELAYYDAVFAIQPAILETSDDPDVVILKVFQDDTQSKSTTPVGVPPHQIRIGRTPSPFSSAASSIRRGSLESLSESTPLMNMAHRDGRDHHIIYYYKNFVYRHLAQVHRDSLGTSLETGAPAAPDVFETQAAAFMPVSAI